MKKNIITSMFVLLSLTIFGQVAGVNKPHYSTGIAIFKQKPTAYTPGRGIFARDTTNKIDYHWDGNSWETWSSGGGGSGADWNTDLTNIPADIADGDDNTQLNEAAVDAFVANNGYLTQELHQVSSDILKATTPHLKYRIEDKGDPTFNYIDIFSDGVDQTSTIPLPLSGNELLQGMRFRYNEESYDAFMGHSDGSTFVLETNAGITIQSSNGVQIKGPVSDNSGITGTLNKIIKSDASGNLVWGDGDSKWESQLDTIKPKTGQGSNIKLQANKTFVTGNLSVGSNTTFGKHIDVGSRSDGLNDASINISEDVTNANGYAANSHGVTHKAVIDVTGTTDAHNSFNSELTLTAADATDHLSGYQITWNKTGAGSLQDALMFNMNGMNFSGGNTNRIVGLDITGDVNLSGGATSQQFTGVYIGQKAVSAKNYGFWSNGDQKNIFKGQSSIGTEVDPHDFPNGHDVYIGGINGMKLGGGSTATRPTGALGGGMRYNTNFRKIEVYDDFSWKQLGSSYIGIGGTANWDTALDPGMHNVLMQSTHAGTPPPETAAGTHYYYLSVEQASSIAFRQEAKPYFLGDTGAHHWYRTYYNGTWTQWERYYTSRDIKGPYATTAAAAADANLGSKQLFKVSNGDGTSSVHVKD